MSSAPPSAPPTCFYCGWETFVYVYVGVMVGGILATSLCYIVLVRRRRPLVTTREVTSSTAEIIHEEDGDAVL